MIADTYVKVVLLSSTGVYSSSMCMLGAGHQVVARLAWKIVG